jgi:hypothetical protein
LPLRQREWGSAVFFLTYLLAQPKLKAIRQPRGGRFTVLDVGAGNHSARKMKRVYPNCIYHGVDRIANYNNDDADRQKMDQFFQVDLDSVATTAVIPDSTYDVIIIAHVIEHLYDGSAAILALLPKLKPGGCIYIEFPSVRSLSLPSMRGCLNFSDDPTHVRLYDVGELGNLLLSNGFRIVRGGRRRDWIRVLLLPLLFIRSALQRDGVQASIFWDLLGFADYIYARKLR